MANGFGSLYVGASALQSQQNALNVVANNLSNVNTTGYVRQQVLFADRNYTTFASASVSAQQLGLGVSIGDVVHARDIFLDKAYRSESGRQAFYAASYDAVSEVETYLQESDGEAFRSAIDDLYEAFSEFAKDPSDAVNQNLVMQKASLFVSRTKGLDQGLQDYQSTINTKISDDVDRINELGKKISELNLKIQKIEAANVETAMDLRDTRDLYLDELAGLANISYTETNEGVVKVQLEGVEFVSEVDCKTIALQRDAFTGFETPYWPQLSDTDAEDYYYVFNTGNVDATKNTDVGEVKALLLARGDHFANYMDIDGLSEYDYENGLSNSVMMNSEAEIDLLTHNMITAINDVLCPNKTYDGAETVGVDAAGNKVVLDSSVKILDTEKCSVGSDGELPPQELFSRTGCERYTKVTLDDGSSVYVYNEEDPSDTSKCYTIRSINVNPALVEDESLIPHMTQNGLVDYNLGAALEAVWDDSSFTLNPSDTTPCTFTEFYTKMVGELATLGSVYSTTSESLQNTTDTIDTNRQAVIGVSSDEELTNMIKYQAAYNAASRYINVVSEMIDYLLSSL
jgi:flagellar hook-associated protein 1 FlgK